MLGGDLGPVNTFGVQDQGQSQRKDIQFVIYVPRTYKNYSMHKVTLKVMSTGYARYVPPPPHPA